MSQQPKKLISTWLSVVFVVVLLGGGGYLLWYFYSQAKTKETPITTPSATTADWKTYKNESFKYSISIPKDWTVIPSIVLDSPNDSKELEDDNVVFADNQMQQQLRIIVCETCKKGDQYGTLKNFASDIGPVGRESIITNQEQFRIGQTNGYKETVKSSFYVPNNTTQYFAENKNYYITFINLNSSSHVEEILATFKLDLLN